MKLVPLSRPVAVAHGSAEAEKLLPLTADKTAMGPVTTYICQDFACQAPLVGADAVAAALGN